MPVTLEQLSAFLEAEGLRFRSRPAEGDILTGFVTRHYADRDGEKSLRLVIRLRDDGRCLSVFAPGAWNLHECKHREAAFVVLMTAQWQTLYVQFEFDPTDGEVRPTVEFPVVDGTVTRQQLMRMVYAVTGVVDQYADTVRKAMETGEVDPAVTSGGLPPGLADFLERLRREAAGAAEPPGLGPETI
jgi:hypothetical protein